MLPMLEILDVSHNRLDGNLLNQWETAKLVELDAHDNALTGQLPASLAQLPRLAYLQLQVTFGWLAQWNGEYYKPTALLWLYFHERLHGFFGMETHEECAATTEHEKIQSLNPCMQHHLYACTSAFSSR